MAIQIRRGTDAEWESNKSNIVAGEPAVAMDTERMFIGTGSGTYMEVANIETIADAFDSSTTYAVGDYCTYGGKLYKFTSAHSGAWSSGDVSEVTIAENLGGEAVAMIGNLNDLTTTAKSDVVSAINEVDGDLASKADLSNESYVEKKYFHRTSDIFTAYATLGYLTYSSGVFNQYNGYHTLLYTFTKDTDISISKDDGGLVIAVLFSETLSTLPTTSTAANQYFVKGARSDKTGADALPTEANKWHVTAGQMLAISTQDDNAHPNTNFTLTIYESKSILSNDIVLNNTQTEQIANIVDKKPIIRYHATNDIKVDSFWKDQITFFLPNYSGYIKYCFVHNEADARNANNWRLDRCYLCDDSLNVILPICTDGEWEMALKINGRDDFIGGILHGDEVMTALHVLIDGHEIDDITTIKDTEFEQVNIVETTLLYDPADGATLSTRTNYDPVGVHGKEYIITKDGIRLTQSITLSSALTLNASYITMLPLIRGNDTKYASQITDRYFANNDYIEYDISVGESGSAWYGWKKNVTRATVWGESSGVCAIVEMLKQPTINNAGARMFQVQDTLNQYNKLYWSLCGIGNNLYNASANERFDIDTLFRISVKA